MLDHRKMEVLLSDPSPLPPPPQRFIVSKFVKRGHSVSATALAAYAITLDGLGGWVVDESGASLLNDATFRF